MCVGDGEVSGMANRDPLRHAEPRAEAGSAVEEPWRRSSGGALRPVAPEVHFRCSHDVILLPDFS